MKRSFFVLLALLFALASPMNVQARGIQFVEASDLTMIGKLFPETPNPWHRIDTERYDGFTESERKQVRQSSGIAVAFRTDSESILVRPVFSKIDGGGSTGPVAKQGFDLYIREKGVWRWAGQNASGKSGEAKGVIHRMEEGKMHDCLLYLPLFAQLESLEIGVFSDCTLEPLKNPFRSRIAVFGSSYTQGYGCSRPGRTWSATLARMTGLQMLNLGCSGNSKLQDYFARPLADASVDAFIFDAFSNPGPELIEERLFPFIETIQKKHPGKPLIFIKTIYREWRAFNTEIDDKEKAKERMAAKMMGQAMKKYKDVYYVTTTSAADALHETTVDGTHPGDQGYALWAESICGPVMEILAKYGIK
ncbi:MAG: SGNH/GDSL hydrolase family protein [Bacteroidales bacterium]|nr:SGNH/GDSL hydrolase family protein [Bacteroidales bacterium]